MNFRFNKKIKEIFLLLFISITLSSCTSEALDKLWLKSAGWSRGILMGETSLASPMEPVIDPSGKVYGIVFPRSEVEQGLYQPQLAVLSPDAQFRTQIELDFQIQQPRQAKLMLTGDELDLFWIESNKLKAVQLNKRGERQSEIIVLSTEDRVDHFEVVRLETGYEIWYSGSQDSPGIYVLRGELGSLDKTIIDPDGIRINLFLDADNHLHASWARYPLLYGDAEFFYLQPKIDQEEEPQPVIVYQTGVSPAVNLEGPVLAIDEELGYIIWTEVITSGLDAGTRNTYFRYFPIGEPDFIRPTMAVRIPMVANLPTNEFDQGAFQTGERVYVYSGIPSTSALENIEVLGGQYKEVAFVYRARSEFKWRDFRNQANIAYISDGLVTSYQPLSYTSAESYYPSVISDQDMNLFVTWLEKGETTYRAYLTTTDPVKKYYIDLVTKEDYIYLTAEGVFGMLAGAVLSPFAAAAWGGVGLFAFAINLIFSQFNKQIFKTIGEFISLAASIFVFWWMKRATLPGLRGGDYVPFSAWIPRIPENIQQPLTIGIPIVIGLVALATAYLNTYKKKSGSAINFYLIYCAVDTLLSCAVYGVLIYGSF